MLLNQDPDLATLLPELVTLLPNLLLLLLNMVQYLVNLVQILVNLAQILVNLAPIWVKTSSGELLEAHKLVAICNICISSSIIEYILVKAHFKNCTT